MADRLARTVLVWEGSPRLPSFPLFCTFCIPIMVSVVNIRGAILRSPAAVPHDGVELFPLETCRAQSSSLSDQPVRFCSLFVPRCLSGVFPLTITRRLSYASVTLASI